MVTLWKSKEQLQQHFETPHAKEAIAAFKEAGATVEVTRLVPAL
jgi:quinol monooxygenase YgiN